ncbi:MAG TPA: hypothetical protein VJH03_26590 [Blastocatellia bacterium]|nr:hypothetical protein [Blastocatellia bacterium]
MKTWSLFALLLLVSLASACSKPSGTSSGEMKSEGMKDAGFKRYQIESGIVEYTMSGAQKGAETVYFDRWGMREAKYTRSELTVAGMTQRSNRLTLLDGEWIYAIDLDKRTGAKTQNPLFKQITDRAGTKDLAELGEKMMRDMGGVKTGSEEVAGKMCDVWEVKNLGSKSWVWNSVTLKVQTKMAGMEITSTATRFDADASIPADKFAIPSDVTITEGADVKKALEGLKRGNKD